MNRATPLILAVLLLLSLIASPASGQITARTQRVFEHLKLSRPLYITHPGDGTDRLFIVEQAGKIFVIPNDPNVREAKLVYDHSQKVRRAHNEEGLLGIAFHPNFKSNRQIFLHYSASQPRRNVLSRFTMDATRTRIVPSSEQVILEVPQPHGNHNGGMIEFGPDGMLYIALGDGGSGGDPNGHGQNLSTLLGTILRIDVNRTDTSANKRYAIPKDNPFVDHPEARPEIWAFGLRNVWRFSFDRKTGDLWAGDVGQNLWEEVDLVTKGGNFGWKIREGKHAFDASAKRGPGELIDPVVDLQRSEAWSVTGGYVYRGKQVPQLEGMYVFGDYGSGFIWALRYNTQTRKLEAMEKFAHVGGVASFGEDRDGELYAVALDGQIFKFVKGQ